jgi:hypothetical protein
MGNHGVRARRKANPEPGERPDEVHAKPKPRQPRPTTASRNRCRRHTCQTSSPRKTRISDRRDCPCPCRRNTQNWRCRNRCRWSRPWEAADLRGNRPPNGRTPRRPRICQTFYPRKTRTSDRCAFPSLCKRNRRSWRSRTRRTPRILLQKAEKMLHSAKDKAPARRSRLTAIYPTSQSFFYPRRLN